MERLMARLWGAVLLLLAAAPAARAAPGWSFDWSVTPTSLTANAGDGSLNLTGVSGHATGSTKIGALNLQTISTATAGEPWPWGGWVVGGVGRCPGRPGPIPADHSSLPTRRRPPRPASSHFRNRKGQGFVEAARAAARLRKLEPEKNRTLR